MRDPRPTVLMILDGWGVNPRKEGNAIAHAATPRMDSLTRNYPATTISISGLDVGLPDGQMGNSEVGHMHIGSGRVIYQDLTLIHRAIDDGSFFRNEVLLQAIRDTKRNRGRVHLMGLLGDGGVHSHQRHLEALIELGHREDAGEIYLHLFLDGRDTPPTSAETFLQALLERLKAFPGARIASLSGRFYAMDRDRRWERTEKAYRALTEGVGVVRPSPLDAIRESYRQQVTDEFVVPTLIESCLPAGLIRDKDSVIFFNFRADRARQLTRAFTEENFQEFPRPRRIALTAFVTMTEYDHTFKLPVAFPPRSLRNILGEVVSREGMTQLRIAETEKYAHVTYFFNGGEEKKFALEERVLIPSTKEVPTYDLRPAMSAYEITEALLKKMAEQRWGLVVLNYANADMVGHTGNFPATVRACEVVDECIGKVAEATLKQKGYLLITGDHGNAEQMVDYETGQPHTAHTSNPVPLILVGEEFRSARLMSGSAIDVAPTILSLWRIPKPPEMTGRSLIAAP
ncbi:MAG TPA: 2,3-bisphosphoglycerate-independent phosphoglycerate mutase [Candidatus Acidoferrales bacterium]|nr:2,3-bisphosphoglycerate-independent phosphoglycerate mutase [Candidatus Acidoferrales bacterium]